MRFQRKLRNSFKDDLRFGVLEFDRACSSLERTSRLFFLFFVLVFGFLLKKDLHVGVGRQSLTSGSRHRGSVCGSAVLTCKMIG